MFENELITLNRVSDKGEMTQEQMPYRDAMNTFLNNLLLFNNTDPPGA